MKYNKTNMDCWILAISRKRWPVKHRPKAAVVVIVVFGNSESLCILVHSTLPVANIFTQPSYCPWAKTYSGNTRVSRVIFLPRAMIHELQGKISHHSLLLQSINVDFYPIMSTAAAKCWLLRMSLLTSQVSSAATICTELRPLAASDCFSVCTRHIRKVDSISCRRGSMLGPGARTTPGFTHTHSHLKMLTHCLDSSGLRRRIKSNLLTFDLTQLEWPT